MYEHPDQTMFAVLLGESADEVTDGPGIAVLERIPNVVLLKASYRDLRRLGRETGTTIHRYGREADARRVFALFQH